MLVLCPLSVWASWTLELLPENGRFVFPVPSGPKLLKQCSRDAPQNIKEFWQPSSAQVEELEKKLVGFLSEREKSHLRVPPDKAFYHRQYIGIVLDGVRLIYGNFYRGGKAPVKAEAVIAAVVCDGGPTHWGIIYNTATSKFEEPKFNSEA